MSRKILWLLTILLLAHVQLADAQQSEKTPRIGFLSGGVPEFTRGIGPFRQELRELGYVEGKNITFEYRYAEGKPDRYPALADELVRLKVNVIVASGTTDTLAAKNATTTIPIVFLEEVSDPVALGLVESLARPGGNITGFTTIAAVLAGKRLELLKETIPSLSRVAVLWNPQAPANAPQWKESQLAARQLGLQLHSMEVSSADKYDSAFKEATKAHSAAVAVTRHRLAQANLQRIADLATKYRLPAVYTRADFAERGGLMSYGADEVEPFRRAASMVDKILKGANPATLPVEQPTKFELVVNLKTAKQIGLSVPPQVLARADRVIK